MHCPKCGNTNDDAAKFCARCGTLLDQSTLDQPNEYLKAIIGPSNQEYYLERFSRFETGGLTKPGWHWPAFFITFYWLLYRKMWLYAGLYFFLPYVVLMILGMLSSIAGPAAVGILYLGYILGYFLLPPMFATTLYYLHCKKKIAEVQATSGDVQRKLGELTAKGGTSNIALIIIGVMVVVAFIGILAAIAIPSYNDYLSKARTMEAHQYGMQAAAKVEEFYTRNRAIPESLALAGFSAPLPPAIKEITMSHRNGVIVVTLGSNTLKDKTIELIPSQDATGQITWRCMSRDITERLLPQQCRQQPEGK